MTDERPILNYAKPQGPNWALLVLLARLQFVLELAIMLIVGGAGLGVIFVQHGPTDWQPIVSDASQVLYFAGIQLAMISCLAITSLIKRIGLFLFVLVVGWIPLLGLVPMWVVMKVTKNWIDAEGFESRFGKLTPK
jgi:hypothetical protein